MVCPVLSISGTSLPTKEVLNYKGELQLAHVVEKNHSFTLSFVVEGAKPSHNIKEAIFTATLLVEDGDFEEVQSLSKNPLEYYFSAKADLESEFVCETKIKVSSQEFRDHFFRISVQAFDRNGNLIDRVQVTTGPIYVADVSLHPPGASAEVAQVHLSTHLLKALKAYICLDSRDRLRHCKQAVGELSSWEQGALNELSALLYSLTGGKEARGPPLKRRFSSAETIYAPTSSNMSQPVLLSKVKEKEEAKRARRNAIYTKEESKDVAGIRSWVPAYHAKTEDERARIYKVFSSRAIFQHLEEEQLLMLYRAMFEVTAKAGDVIIEQGEQGENFYIIDHGICEVYVAQNGPPKLVLTCHEGDSFGELSLVYDSPRAATVKATTDCRLWAVDRKTYQSILMKLTLDRRELYSNFLKRVPLLSSLNEYERLLIADCVEPRVYDAGQVIVRQGDEGRAFAIIEYGEVICTQKYDDSKPEAKVGTLGPGQYFGEISLLTDRPRVATVTATKKTKVCCASHIQMR